MRITRRHFNSFQLKLIAACAMLIDHTAHVFFPTAFYMRCIGRLAFPLFAFMVAEGYAHTRNVEKYMVRMLIFAVIAQAPYMLIVGNFDFIHFNVIFTLLSGLIAVYAIDKGRLATRLIVPIILAILAELGGFDHGAFGVFMVISFYYTRNSAFLRNISSSSLIFLFAASYMLRNGFLSFGWLIMLFYFASVPLINLYNGKKGISNPFTKWFFYVFYPLHLIVLAILK